MEEKSTGRRKKDLTFQGLNFSVVYFPTIFLILR